MMPLSHTVFTALACSLLAACGGSGSDNAGGNSAVPVPAPAVPSAEEAAEFEARKSYSFRGPGTVPTWMYSAGGHTIMELTTDGGPGNVFKFDARALPQGMTTLAGERRSPAHALYPTRESWTLRSYQGFRSGVLYFYRDSDLIIQNAYYGDDTQPAQLPAAGKATYSGTAFDRHHEGTLTYHVDFGAKTGQGTIEGIPAYGTITMAEGKIDPRHHDLPGMTKVSILGEATAASGQQLHYRLYFFGNLAEEIAGHFYTADNKTKSASTARAGR